MSQSEKSSDCSALVEQLLDPRTRRSARQKLVAARAVEPLLECLDAINESVVWSAIESLGELRAQQAVEPLIDLIARGTLAMDAAEALTRITGQDFGTDVARWRKWIAQSGDKKPDHFDVAECVQRTAEYLGVRTAGSDKSYTFKLSLPDERSQKVGVFFGRQDTDGDEIVVIYSECGPASPKHYEAVLRKNLSIPAGAFAIRDIGGKPNFVIVDTLLSSVVTPSLLAKHIENIAARADLVEKGLVKEDSR